MYFVTCNVKHHFNGLPHALILSPSSSKKKKNHRKQKTTTKNSEVRNKETLLAHNSTWLPNSEQKLNSEILQAFKYHSLPLKHVYEEKNLLHHIQEKAKNFKFKTNIILS